MFLYLILSDIKKSANYHSKYLIVVYILFWVTIEKDRMAFCIFRLIWYYFLFFL